jgi:hypothetical protein
MEQVTLSLLWRCFYFKSGGNNPIDFSLVFSEALLPFLHSAVLYPKNESLQKLDALTSRIFKMQL